MSNPYETPQATLGQRANSRQQTSDQISAEDARIVRYAQLGLRLLGVSFFLGGICEIAGGAVWWAFESAEAQQAGYPPVWSPLSWVVAGLASLLVGAYLMIGGRWLLELVFLPSSTSVEAEEDHPSDSAAETDD